MAKFHTQFDPPPKPEVTCGPSMTAAEFAQECDINNIIKTYERSGVINAPFSPTSQPRFGDFSAVPDLIEAQNAINDAAERFNALPAHLRARFNNDPMSLLEFVQNSSNRDEAVRLGLIDTIVSPEGPADNSAGGRSSLLDNISTADTRPEHPKKG